MTKRLFSFWMVALLGLTVILSGCFLAQAPEESSGQVVAPTVEVEAEPEVVEEEPAEEVMEEEMEEETEEEMAEEAMEEDASEEMAEEATEDAMMEEEAEEEMVEEESDAAAEAPAGGLTVYTIDTEQSEVRFLIDEVLRGSDVTVVGVTSNFGGQVAFDTANPGSAELSEILINARDIVTDNNFRNRAINNAILETATYEFITFSPTSISGLPDAVAMGEAVTFQITGDLTITDVTGEVTFDATVTPVSETEISGFASTSILYADWGLTIPFSQSVDSVEDDVALEIEFVATSE